MQRGLWRPNPDNTARPGDRVRRADALHWLVRWIEASRDTLLRTGSLQTFDGAAITMRVGGRSQQIPLTEDPFLFRMSGERSLPVENVRVIGGERIAFHLRRDGKIDFLEVELNATGAASDRFSPQATWQVTIPARSLSEKLKSLAPQVGEVQDLSAARLGRSGRWVEIEVKGNRRSAVLNGYKVRTALSLKDTLFTLSRNRDREGRIESFTFDGRGWGHGVGLCQVGAYGMARAGRSFQEILRAYYLGVEIRAAY
jgi:stage II sporulation protein D